MKLRFRIITVLLTAILLCGGMPLSIYADGEEQILRYQHLSIGTLDKFDNQIQTSDNEFKTFQDERLIGSVDEIDTYVRGGGIEGYLKEVLSITVTNEYEFVEETKDAENGILILQLRKKEEAIASIIIWTNFGQLSVRSEIYTSYLNPLTDHGEILLYPVWDNHPGRHTEMDSAICCFKGFPGGNKCL